MCRKEIGHKFSSDFTFNIVKDKENPSHLEFAFYVDK